MFIRINNTQVINMQNVMALTIERDRVVRVYTMDGDSWIVDPEYSERVKQAMSKLNFYYEK